MYPFASARLAQTIYDERIAEALAHGACTQRPANQMGRPRIDVFGAIRAVAASLRTRQRSRDDEQPVYSPR